MTGAGFAHETGPRLDKDTGKTPNYREAPVDSEQLEVFEWAVDWSAPSMPTRNSAISKHRTACGIPLRRHATPPAIERGKLSHGIETFIVRSEARQEAARSRPRSGGVGEELIHLLQAGFFSSLLHLEPRSTSSRTRPAGADRLRGCRRRAHGIDAGRRRNYRRSTPIRSIGHRRLPRCARPKAAHDHLRGRQIGSAGAPRFLFNAAADCKRHPVSADKMNSFADQQVCAARR